MLKQVADECFAVHDIFYAVSAGKGKGWGENPILQSLNIFQDFSIADLFEFSLFADA